LKTRLLGAAVLIALLVIFVPMFFSSNPSPAAAGDQAVSLAIPPAQDSNLQTRTMSLSPGAPANSGTVAPAPAASTAAAAPAAGDRLATVDIASRRPTDVGTDAAAPKAQQTGGPVMGSGASPSQPVIPLQGQGSTAATSPAAKLPAKTAVLPTAAPAPAPVAMPPAAAVSADRALYVLNLSAYANANSVDHLVRRVRSLGYPVLTRVVTQAGKQLTLVTAGPFDSRTSAEAARLKITQSIPGVPAKLVEGLGHADSNIASTPVKAAATTTAAHGRCRRRNHLSYRRLRGAARCAGQRGRRERAARQAACRRLRRFRGFGQRGRQAAVARARRAADPARRRRARARPDQGEVRHRRQRGQRPLIDTLARTRA
jgi:cell division septation protein DedD